MSDLPDNLRLWVIAGSMPPTPAKQWRTNVTVHVLASTAARALAVAEERRPGLRVSSLAHKGETPNIYVDDLPTVEVDRG